MKNGPKRKLAFWYPVQKDCMNHTKNTVRALKYPSANAVTLYIYARFQGDLLKIRTIY